MSRGIPISHKHGVNPTIPLCIFCGKEKNMIALLGKLPNDAEAPRHCVLDYEPCDECKAQFAQGVAAVEVVTSQPADKRPPIQQGCYPTGRVLVFTAEGATRCFDREFKVGDKMLLEKPVFDHFMSQAPTTDPTEQG